MSLQFLVRRASAESGSRDLSRLRTRSKTRPPRRHILGFNTVSPARYDARMAGGPTPHQLSERIARPEERMKTMQTEYKTDIGRLAEYMARRDAEALKRDTEAAKRDKDNLHWMIGLWIAAVVVLGFVIRLSAD